MGSFLDYLNYYTKQYRNSITKGNAKKSASSTDPSGDETEPAITSMPKLMKADFPWNGRFSYLTIKKDMPDMEYITISANRIWGCSNAKHEIYACKQGDPTSWRTYAGIANDAYAVTIGSDGDFTGACTYKGMPFFFKENLIICLYGTKPSNYQVSEIYYPGIEKGSSDSLALVNGYVYFKSKKGVVRFDGSSTQTISDELGLKAFNNAVGGAGEEKYYIAMQENGVNHLFVYDTRKQMWHKEDDGKPRRFFRYKQSLFGIMTTDQIVRYEGMNIITNNLPVSFRNKEIEETSQMGEFTIHNRGIDWYAETGPIESGSTNAKHIQRLGIRYELGERAWLKVSVKYDNEEKWIKAYEHEGKKSEGPVNIAFRPRRCEKFRLRFEGEGDCKILSCETTFRFVLWHFRKAGGENLYPVQIENFLSKFPKIKDVAVIGLADERLGEIAAAIIELNPDTECTEQEINDFCKELPRYKRPKKIIFTKVPRNATGKIEKPKLREMYHSSNLVDAQNKA